jgi:hypothetical protein
MPDPADNPPDNVIVTEWCRAQYSGTAFGAGVITGECNNDLGSEVTTFTYPIYAYPYPVQIGYTKTGAAEGTRYTLKPGGEAVDLSCSPSASGSVTVGGSGGCSVRYTSSVQPLYVALAGVTTDPTSGDMKVLTGQQVTASLVSPIPVKNDANGNPIITWTPPANVFKDYTTGTTGVVVLLQATDLNQSTCSFFTKAGPQALTVQCQATLDFPTGSILAGGLPQVNVSSKPLQSVKPTVVWNVISGSVQMRADGGAFGLYGVPNPPNVNGQRWKDVDITVPAPFVGGTGCFAQLAKVDRKIYRVLAEGSTAAPFYKYITSEYRLDNQFPYLNMTWTVGPQKGQSGDSPFQPVSETDIDAGGSNWNQSTAKDDFKAWVMYRPPSKSGRPTAWIPLQMYTWSWTGTADFGVIWTASGPAPTTTNPAASDVHPTWDFILINGWHMVP